MTGAARPCGFCGSMAWLTCSASRLVSSLTPTWAYLEPVEDQSARAANAAADRRYEFERSQREADERNRIVARSKVQLEERRRALGLDSARVSYRSVNPG